MSSVVPSRPDAGLVAGPFDRIRLVGDPVLTRPTAAVEEFDGALARLVTRMTAAMDREDGIGLAAPQLGVPRRVLVWAVDATPRGWRRGGPARGVLVNPSVTAVDGEATLREGCLSVPGHHPLVTRPASLSVRAVDPAGAPVELDLDGMVARVVLHELDHLDGRLIAAYRA